MTTDTDETDIVALLDREAKAFWDKDFAAFADCFVHAPSTRRLGWSPLGIVNTPGWDKIAERMQKLMRENPTPNPSAAALRRDNLNINVNGDLAWLTFDQTSIATGDRQMDMPGISHEARVMERQDGTWKIAFTSFLLEP